LKITEYIKGYLIFSRGEKEGIRILAIVILVLFFLRFIIPGILVSKINNYYIDEKEIVDFIESVEKKEIISTLPNILTVANDTLFNFDPNNATTNEFIMLGLSNKIAKTIKNYIKAGGKFREKADFQKIYGLTQWKYKELEPYINIKQEKLNDGNIIELNSADSINLKYLPGIGPKLANRIIKFRNFLGGFVEIDQVKEVYGIKEDVFIKFRNRLCVDTLLVKKLDINFYSFKDLVKHPYINSNTANAILKHRSEYGIFQNQKDLRDKGFLNDSILGKILPYLKFINKEF